MRPPPICLLLVVLFILGACGGGEGPADSPLEETEAIHIGMLVPISGPWVKGPAWRQAAAMAVDEINSEGGVLGRNLDLLIADTETVPEIAVRGARRLIADEVVAIIGAGTSSSTLAVAEQTSIPAGVVLISPSSTAAAVADLDDDGLVWRTVPSDIFQGRLAAQWAFDNGHRTAGILYVDNEYGAGLADAFTGQFERLGARVTAAISYPELSSEEIVAHDYALPVARVFAAQPDLVYLITYDQDGAKITVVAAGYLTAEYAPTFLGSDGNTSQAFIDNSAPAVVEGMAGTVPIAPEDNADYRAFVERYTARYGIAPEGFSESTYDAVYLLALAMLRAGSTDSRQIAAHLRAVSAGGTRIIATQFATARDLLAAGQEIDYAGASGAVDFDARGDLLSGTYRIWRVENGAFTVIQTTAFP